MLNTESNEIEHPIMHFVSPCNCLIVGQSQSGKSVFIEKLILNREKYISGAPINHVVYCCKNKRFAPNELESSVPNFKVFEGVPDISTIKNNTLLIIDDLMVDLDIYSKKIKELFCVSSHHCQISVFLLLQNLYCGKLSGDISYNAHYIVFMRSMRNKRYFSYLARQLAPNNWRSLENAYIEALKIPYSHFCVDMSQRTNDLFRIKSDILQPDYYICYIPDDNLEAAEKIFTIEDEQIYLADASAIQAETN